MEDMDFDPETLLASGSSDPMLGKPAEQLPVATQEHQAQQSQPPPSGSFIVLQSGGSPGGGPGSVTQLGNISVSSLAPGQGARAATSRLTAVMGRAASSVPGNLTKFIISPGQATSSAAPVRMLGGTAAGRVAAPASAPPAVVPAAAGPGTLTLTSAQAQQMGLISPRKGTAIDGVRQGVSPKRIVIRSSPAPQAKPGVMAGAAVAAGGTVQPPYRVLTQSGLQQAVSTARGQSVQFVRVVGSASGQPSFSTAGPVPVAPAAAAAAATGTAPVKIAIAPGGRVAPVQTAQRLLLPATPPAGAPVAAAAVTGGPELLRPAPTAYSRPRAAPQQPRLGRPPNTTGPGRVQTQKAAAHVARPSGRGGSGDVPQIRPRKPCNCTKSQCLKLYCDCFASGEFCNNCNCTNCFNSLDREEERRRAIRACLDRNPFAFKPKIGKSDNETRKHQKGCNCKKSGCLKNYCECYEAKIFCSSQCKCMGCKNYESANARPARPGAGAAASLEDPFSLLPAAEPGPSAGGRGGGGGRRSGGLKVATFPVTERAPAAVRVTQDVIDATLSCLMTEAAGAATGQEAQRRVLREFGRCLSEIIDYGSRRDTTVPGMV